MQLDDIPSLLRPDHYVDRYKIIKHVAKGVFAQIFLAEDTELKRRVALRFNCFLKPTPQLDERIKDAACMLAGLQHSGLLAIYDIGDFFGLTYLVCEYAPGSLAGEISEDSSKDRVDWLIDVMSDVSRSLDYIHRRGFVHRNVNPKTILFDASGHPKLGGFELAIRSEAVPDDIAGTPAYMSPEQITGDTKNIGPATDIWAIGATIYHALTGRPPFEEASMDGLRRAIVEDNPVPLRQIHSLIPENVEQACLKCLSKEPSKRYVNAQLLARDFSGTGRLLSAQHQRVFVSHSSRDREIVEEAIISTLEKNAIDTWYSKVDIQTAAEWERSIVSGLESCAWFMLVMSPSSASSDWVKDELFWAIENRRGKIVPVLIGDCNPQEFHIRLARIEQIDLRDGTNQARERLIDVFRNVGGSA